MPPRCAACPADMYADHALRLAQEVVTENFFLCLLRQTGKCPLYGVCPPEDGALLLYAADLSGSEGGLRKDRGFFEEMRLETGA